MTHADAGAVLDLLIETFADLAGRTGTEPRPYGDRAPGLVRICHLQRSDAGGAWVTEDGEGVVDGAALALLREGLWGLSLLVVRPGCQSAGLGSALLEAALAYGAGSHGGIILASEDPRALRAYWRAGFALRPVLDVRGPILVRPEPAPAVRAARWPADRALVDAASRAVRGAAHGADIDAQLASGCELLVHGGGGFVVLKGGTVRALAATQDEVARDLLRAALRAVPDGDEVQIDFLDAPQDWAVDVALEAGLRLVPSGAICVRGEVGPMRPYIPSGAYL